MIAKDSRNVYAETHFTHIWEDCLKWFYTNDESNFNENVSVTFGTYF